ncbi:protein NO VEIN domain-containing protein [Phormidesmis sp. 146-12]
MREITELLEFLTHQMTMAAVYQPAIILYLLTRNGFATRAELAKMLSGYDGSDLSLWDRVLMDAPKRALVGGHNIVDYDKGSQIFKLEFNLHNSALVTQAQEICITKIDSWIHKRISSQDISEEEALRLYRVLEIAKSQVPYQIAETSFEMDEFALKATLKKLYQRYPDKKITQQSYESLGFDILVGSVEQAISYVKVKATQHIQPIFYISEAERRFSLENSEKFLLSVIYQINLQAETYQVFMRQGAIDYSNFGMTATQWQCRLLSPD